MEGIEENEGGILVIDDSFPAKASKSSSLVHLCLPCGSSVTSNIKLEASEYKQLADNEIFSGFCELLKIRLSGRFVWWTFNPGSSSSKIFCEDCKRELSLLYDLKKRLAELENDLESGIQTFKDKCCRAESKFKENDIYQKDKRYVQIRRQITKGITLSAPPRQGSEDEVTTSRKSSLRKRPVPAPEYCQPESPNAKLSKVDERKVDHHHKSSVEFKNEPVSEEEHELDSFLDDSLEMPTVIPNNSEEPPRSPENISSGESNERKRTQQKTAKSAMKKLKLKKRMGTSKATKKELPRGLRKRKKKTVPLSEDDGEEEFDPDYDSKPQRQRPQRKRQKRVLDKDFDPATDGDDVEEDDDDEDERGSIKSERVRFKPETGHYYFLNVAYEKLDNGKYRCLECKDKEIIIFKYTIRKHSLRAHTNVYSCKECGHCEGSQGDLQKHIRDYHDGRGQRFTDCPTCGKPCSSYKGRLQRHMATHYSKQEKEEAIARGETILTWADVHSKKDYQCDNCGKAFESKWYLRQHILAKHPTPGAKDEGKNEKELCSKCGKLFLKYYIKTHQVRCQDSTGPESNRKFICTLCDKRFYRYVELSRHKMNVHEKNYPEQCSLCSKGFANKRQLRVHMNRHMGVRPFTCPHCPSAFFTNGNLTRHVGIYHTEGSNPKRKPYSKKGETANEKDFANNGGNKVEKKVTPLNNVVEVLPKVQDDLLKSGHFMLASMSNPAPGSQTQELADVVLFSDFPNPPATD